MDSFDNYPFMPGPRGVPAGTYEARREREPLGKVRLPSGDTAYLTTTYEDAILVLSDPRFSRELGYPGAPRMFRGFTVAEAPGILTSMDPPEHTRLRRLLSGVFMPRQVNGWRPRLRALTGELIDALPEEFDFLHEFAFPLPVQVVCDIMGVPGIDVVRVRAWSDAMLSTSGLSEEAKLAAAGEFHAYMAEVVAAHRADPGDGLLAAMIHARDGEDRLSEKELVRNALGLFLAGHETTGSVLARSIVRLLDPRDTYDRLAARPDLVPGTVEELLRLEQPGDSPLIRVATEDVELPSGKVRKGEGVIASFAAANLDPSVFPDPHTVDLNREATHLAFGRGPHYCLGANLARMELQEILGVLVRRLPGLELARPAGELEWTAGSIMVRPVRVPVRKRGRWPS
ncbi:cytochrome P450 [Nonomuraea jiangxiensis]|uniref:Cytochrome P450 n=1 Tax=Nonomuraea jiangxiensis TaxID=633440 RepID=A0A1G8T3R9_9ACTN|nr:cytochrome P450 [Nonomuraea jiangxiensis]SDJ36218.1 Cytochrome P450 [Nonomuraea jiangxiensis]